MNIHTITGRTMTSAACEPATDVHPLGAPINREKPQQEDPGKWVKAATPEYLLHTRTKAVSHKDQVPVKDWPKGMLSNAPGLCLESGEFIPAAKLADDTATCGVVPGLGELLDAVIRIGPRHWHTTKALPGLSEVTDVNDIPADRRADVIAALNKLGA